MQTQLFGGGIAPELGGSYMFAFDTLRDTPSLVDGGPVTFEPHLVDKQVGIGRQIAVGHLDTDGVMDICVGTKLGLYVFLGQAAADDF